MSHLIVAKKPVKIAWTVKNEDNTVSKKEMKVASVELKQYDSIAEWQNECGGEDKSLIWLNKQTAAICKRDAAAAGKAVGEKEDDSKREESARHAAKNFNPARSVNRKEGTKQKLEAYEAAEAFVARIKADPSLQTPENMQKLMEIFATSRAA